MPQDSQTAPNLQPQPITPWQPFPHLDWLRGGISTTADGGMSWTGMDSEVVVENRRRYFEKFGLDINRAISADQTHGVAIYDVREADLNRGMMSPDTRIPATDALVTRLPNVVLTTLHADCAPVFFADPVQRVIALAHAGWKGVLAGLPGLVLEHMCKSYHSRLSDIQIAVGPMICPEHYPVDDDRATAFRVAFGPDVITNKSPGGKWHLDLLHVIRLDLARHNLPTALNLPRLPCTWENAQFASYRRDGTASRSMLAWLMIPQSLSPCNHGGKSLS
jgi:polyphenol oxidase